MATVFLVAGCGTVGGGGDQADEIANKIDSYGGTTCESTGYYISNRLDGSKQTIYSCSSGDGTFKCYTESGGIVRDATETVRLLFTDTVGSDKPACIT